MAKLPEFESSRRLPSDDPYVLLQKRSYRALLSDALSPEIRNSIKEYTDKVNDLYYHCYRMLKARGCLSRFSSGFSSLDLGHKLWIELYESIDDVMKEYGHRETPVAETRVWRLKARWYKTWASWFAEKHPEYFKKRENSNSESTLLNPDSLE